MKYLVTGVAGFIGAKVAQILLERGHKIIGIDNLNDYYDVSLKHMRLNSLKKSQDFAFHQLDIESLPLLKELFSHHSFDAVINLAARAGVRYSMENPHLYMSTNALGTLNILECMRSANIKKLVLASTSSLYAGQKMPFNEELPVNTPISPYAASKKAAESIAYTYHHLYGLDVSIVRYFTVYGPNGRPDMAIWKLINCIKNGVPFELYGNGTQSRDFTYVDDIADGTIAALKDVGYEIINLGGGKNPISLNSIIEKLELMIGKKATIINKPFHKADLKDTWADIDKAKRILDWKPVTDIDAGLKLTIYR